MSRHMIILWVTVGTLAVFALGFGISRATQTDSPQQLPRKIHGNTQAPGSLAAMAATLRKTYESKLESAIVADANLMVQVGRLPGPVLGVACTPMEQGGTPVIDNTLHYNCIAIRRRSGSMLEGARYFGTINVETGGYTYHGD